MPLASCGNTGFMTCINCADVDGTSWPVLCAFCLAIEQARLSRRLRRLLLTQTSQIAAQQALGTWALLFKTRFAQRRIQPFEQLLVQRLGVAIVFPVLHDGLQLDLLRAGHVQMAALRRPDGVLSVRLE